MRAMQQIEIGDALAAADDLAVALRRQDVDAERDFRAVRIRLHVERLHLRRIAVHADRAIELLRQRRLVGRAEVAAPLERRCPFFWRISTASS